LGSSSEKLKRLEMPGAKEMYPIHVASTFLDLVDFLRAFQLTQETTRNNYQPHPMG
jgi:hypothetical protein